MKPKAKKRPNQRHLKLDRWFKYFIDETKPNSFMNATASAMAAGYRATEYKTFSVIGSQNFVKLKPQIKAWMDECGLSEERLKAKLIELVNCKETVFQKLRGACSADLPPGYTLVTTSGLIESTKDGNVFGDGDTLIAIEMDCLETQRRTLDMAFKSQGLYAPEKREITGKDGKPIEVRQAPPMETSDLEALIAKTGRNTT